MIPVRFQRGIELPEHGIWLDPWDTKPFAFVSHAHSDHTGNHPEVVLSATTARLMRARVPGERVEHALEFDQPAQIHGLDITLFPAGHIFGSAQFFLQTADDSLLYTGDFKLRTGLSAEPARSRHADTLIMETTFGLPKYRFPPASEVIANMIEFCAGALADGAVPVLLGYSLGKSQEILCALVQAGMTPMLHGSVFRMTEIYRSLRPDFPCGYERYDAEAVAGKVLICPPSANRSAMLRKIKDCRTAILTGWAIEPGAVFRYQCDAAFPLSDHADYDELLHYVELVQPRRVLTLHGYASAFAGDLRARGIEAWALSETDQLELTLATKKSAVVSKRKESVPNPMVASSSEFAAFAALCEQIAATASKLKKVELLRDYLRSLSEAQLPIAATYLTGKAFAQADPRVMHLGWSVIKRALLAASGASEQDFRDISHHHADAGKTAHEILQDRTTPAPFPLTESRAFLEQLQSTRGPIAKAESLKGQLARLSALEAQYLVKILTGDLRIGLKEGLVEEAIASAFDCKIGEVKEANMLLGDVGQTALLASRHALDQIELRLFTPIKCMLASPEPSAEAIWSRLNEAAENPVAWVEDKFDGIRAQLHRDATRAEIFTRDLKRVSAQFDEIAHAARGLGDDVIFDGEIVAFEHGRKLTFFDLQKRLGRKTSADFFLGEAIPVRFMIFDLLWLNGESLLKQPLSARRHALEKLSLPPMFERVAVARVSSAAEIEAQFASARDRGNEGLVIKDAASFYTPGRRGLAWLKLKKELATLDVVVVGAELGHGKRNKVLSDYTFAVRDEKSGELLTIGKAYSGLTDVEIAGLTEHFKANTITQLGRYRSVKPDVVLEVAFDSVQPSDRHASGLALRFPRIKAQRTDKTATDIDTLEYARTLCQSGS
ncbi:MAG: ligase 1 [Chthoniobacter sp.]|jgi:DNA ligase-1|nr:ligase 1 [Chthoniobacter sp.]